MAQILKRLWLKFCAKLVLARTSSLDATHMLFSGQKTGRSSSTRTHSVAGAGDGSKVKAATPAAAPPPLAACACCTASSTYMRGAVSGRSFTAAASGNLQVLSAESAGSSARRRGKEKHTANNSGVADGEVELLLR